MTKESFIIGSLSIFYLLRKIWISLTLFICFLVSFCLLFGIIIVNKRVEATAGLWHIWFEWIGVSARRAWDFNWTFYFFIIYSWIGPLKTQKVCTASLESWIFEFIAVTIFIWILGFNHPTNISSLLHVMHLLNDSFRL